MNSIPPSHWFIPCPFAREALIPQQAGRAIIALIVLLLAHAAGAADFSAGIERFRALGLPDVKDAKYIKVQWRSGGHFSDFDGMNQLKLEGNAWLLEQQDAQRAILLVREVQRLELVDPKIMEARQKKMFEEMQKAGPEASMMFMEAFEQETSGTWKEADLGQDIQKVLAFLQKGGKERELPLMHMGGGPDLFLFAAHVHRKGRPAEANQIIELLFQKTGDNRKVLSQAMNKLADVQYQEAYRSFERTGDWKQYLAAIDALLAKFPGVWRDRPVAERVAAAVRKQIAFQAPPPVAGEDLTEEDQSLAAELARGDKPINPMMRHGMDTLWIVNPQLGLPTGGRGKSALDRILERRMKSIPLLIALLKDEYLLRTKGGPNQSMHFYSGDDDAISPEEIEMRYQSFARPISRGEIAQMLLAPLVTPEEKRFDLSERPNPDEIGKRVREWYAKHKDKSEAELLRWFLAEGTSSERQSALQTLMASDNDADRKEVEKYLLAPDKVAENLNHVVQYARANGAKAKPLVEQYLKAAKALPSLVPAQQLQHQDERWRKRLEDQAKSQLKVLEELTSSKTADMLLREALADNKKWTPQEWQKVNSVLWPKLAGEPPDQVVALFLKGAVETKDDTLAQMLVQSAQQVKYMSMRQPRRPGTPTPVKAAKLDLKANAALWKQLLDRKPNPAAGEDDTDEMGFGMGRGMGMGQLSLHLMTAMAIETLYGDDTFQMRGYPMMQQLGSKAFDLYGARARARLEGRPEAELPGFPDKEKVSSARKTELLQQLQSATLENQHQLTAKLSLEELLVLADLVKEDPKLNQKLAPGSHVIREVGVRIKDEELKTVGGALKGRQLDRKILERLVEEGKKLAGSGNSAAITISRNVPLGGVYIAVQRLPAGMNESFGGRYGTDSGARQAMLTANLMVQTEDDPIHGSAQWQVPLFAPKTEAKPGKGDKSKDDDLLPSALDNSGMAEIYKRGQEEFWKAVDKLFEPTLNACAPYTCSIMAITPQPAKE